MEPSPASDRDGDRIAAEIAEFLVRHREQMLAYARHQMQGQNLAFEPEDVVQSAAANFYRYLRSRVDAVLGDGLPALARRFVKFALSDYRKWLRPRQPGAAPQVLPDSQLSPAESAPGPCTQLHERERRERRAEALRQAMADLEPLDRQILQFRIDDEAHYTFARIAEVVTMREDAVRMRYRRALDRMKVPLSAMLANDSQLGDVT